MLFTICFILLVIITGNNCHLTEGEEIVKSPVIEAPLEKTTEENEVIVKNIERVEIVGNAVEKAQRDGIVPLDDTEKLYNAMVEVIDDIIESVRNVNNAYKFLNAKGIERIVASNLMLSYTELKNRLLMLLDVLFKVAPITTNTLIPINIVDTLLDIFENDDNLALKARVLDVLSTWLPNNPTVQTRVMQVKGLEPFYNEITKLDTSVIKTLLEIFNNILNEHIKARNEKIQKTKADFDRLRLYQRIGLIERISTPTGCNGLLNIFEVAWQFNTKDKHVLTPVLDIMKNVKPFCIRIYRGQTKAIEFFEALLKFVTDPEKEYLMDGLNITGIRLVIQDYVENLKFTARDEF